MKFHYLPLFINEANAERKKKHNKLFTTLRYNIALLASLQLNAYLNPNARTCCVRFLLFILILATDAGTKLLTLVMYMVAETIDQLRITEISVTVTVAMSDPNTAQTVSNELMKLSDINVMFNKSNRFRLFGFVGSDFWHVFFLFIFMLAAIQALTSTL